MSAAVSGDTILEQRGVQRALDAFVVAAAFSRDGKTVAFVLGNGTVRLVDLADKQNWRDVAAHDGAILSLAQDGGSSGFITGGDDGKFRRILADGTIADIFSAGSRWVEHVASFPGEKGKGLLSCSVGKLAHVFDDTGRKLKTLEHPSSVTGLVFDAKGKRVAASHYNGASIWFVAAKKDSPRKLEWKGSHIGIAMSPDGDAVMTAMQENSLHGWRLSDNQHMRMSGYPGKTLSLSFTKGGKWMATSGADSIVIWPFTGGGPMGKAPTELAGGDDITCTRVLCHPLQDAIAGGFADGLVVLADIGSARVLPIAKAGRGSVSALAWSADGTHLAFGTETGFAAIVDFTK
ncbi:MAG: WD40 repeat domain-containing protein [Acetobacteraceae bacterium]|nr:WD40 repeat domain-containing protein [Acetobacteraceae bacterium]MSP29349.1 WD40 repeat domain-containing protein [Acetobacteraceae bacterium]